MRTKRHAGLRCNPSNVLMKMRLVGDGLDVLNNGIIYFSKIDQVLVKLEPLKELFDVEKYGVLLYESGEYPLFAFRTRGWESSKKTVLVTGGVHGYETSNSEGFTSQGDD